MDFLLGVPISIVCWMATVSRWALAPVAACGEATKPGLLAPNGSLNQQSPTGGFLNRAISKRGVEPRLANPYLSFYEFQCEQSIG
jgi:hypothetical protein